jgi:hypothetical protein
MIGAEARCKSGITTPPASINCMDRWQSWFTLTVLSNASGVWAHNPPAAITSNKILTPDSCLLTPFFNSVPP